MQRELAALRAVQGGGWTRERVDEAIKAIRASDAFGRHPDDREHMRKYLAVLEDIQRNFAA